MTNNNKPAPASKADGRTSRREPAGQSMREHGPTTQTTPPPPFAEWDDLTWFSDGVQELAKTATCACGGAIRPLRGSSKASESQFCCDRCGKTMDYESLIDQMAIPWNEGLDGTPRFSDDSFVTCPCCGHESFRYGEKICYRCGEHDSCIDAAGHEIKPEDMEEYAATENCPECNHIAEMMAADD